MIQFSNLLAVAENLKYFSIAAIVSGGCLSLFVIAVMAFSYLKDVGMFRYNWSV